MINYSGLLKKIVNPAGLLLGLTISYLIIFCFDCVIYGLRARQIILITGIILCLARLINVFITPKDEKLKWLQLLLPAFILIELLFLLFDKISFWAVAVIVPVFEAIFIAAVIILVRKSVKSSENSEPAVLRVAGFFIPPYLVRWLAFEIAVISHALYGFSHFFRSYENDGWTYWRTSAFPLIFMLLIFVAPVELIVVHYLLNIKSVFIHIVTIFLFFWSLLYIYGFWISMKLLPHRLGDDTISLNRGILGKIEVSIRLIKFLRIIQTPLPGEKAAVTPNSYNLTVPGTPRVEITLAEPVKISGIWHTSEQFTDVILVSVDEPDSFCRKIDGLREELSSPEAV